MFGSSLRQFWRSKSCDHPQIDRCSTYWITSVNEHDSDGPIINSINDIQPVLAHTLRDLPPPMEKCINELEKLTGVAREKYVYGIIAIIALYLLIGREAALVCNLLCFIYPAYRSLRILDQKTTKNTLQWILYWLVFGTFSVFDYYADDICQILPYWVLKCFCCVYLFLPQTDGANRVREHVLAPIFKILHRKPRELLSLVESIASATKLGLDGNLSALREAHLPVFFVIGGPGAGKGTQCLKITEKYGLTHLSTGELLRAEVDSKKSKQSARTAELDRIIRSGGLVPMETVLDLLKEAMSRAAINGSPGFLIDGYPRDVTQGVKFENEIQAPDLVLCFEVSEKTLIDRCMHRAKSGSRTDDNPETIKNRLRVYKTATAPVIDYYEKKGKLVRIPAEGTPNEVFSHVEVHLDKIMSEVLQRQQNKLK